VLEAGILAPTAKNIQPFRIFVIDAAKNRESLSRAYRGAWILEAPLVIAIASDLGLSWKRGSDGKSSSDIDAAIAMDHMVLAATSLGLGTCWICAFEPEPLSSLLGLSSGWEPLAITPLGYALESPEARGRRPRSELVSFL
jgi:nitroreductase